MVKHYPAAKKGRIVRPFLEAGQSRLARRPNFTLIAIWGKDRFGLPLERGTRSLGFSRVLPATPLRHAQRRQSAKAVAGPSSFRVNKVKCNTRQPINTIPTGGEPMSLCAIFLMFTSASLAAIIVTAITAPRAITSPSTSHAAAIVQSVTSLVAVLALAFTIYTYFALPPDGLIEFSKFPNPPQIGTDKLTVTYIFTSTGKLAHLIQEVGIYEIYKQADGQANEDNSGMCLDERFGSPSTVALLPQQVKDALTKYNDMMAKYTTPVQVALADGTHDNFDTMLVPPQEQRAITATFRTTPANLDRFNAVAICPTFQYLDATGQPTTVVCKGWNTKFVTIGGLKGGRFDRSGPGAVRLLPSLDTTLCRTTF